MDILIEEQEGSIWVAALSQGRLEGLEIDPVDEPVRWGSIFRARVESIDKAMDAAYLRLDGQNTGILFNADVRLKKGKEFVKGGEKPIGKVLQPGQMIAVQAKSIYPGQTPEYARFESKLPRMSMDIALAGRYLIHCPLMAGNRLSQRIRGKKLRGQIETMMRALDDIEGCILRSSAAHTQTEMLLREGRILKAAWEEIIPLMQGSEPALIMQGPDAIQRTLSDQAGAQIERIEITTMDHFTLAEEWCTVFAPDLVTKINPVELPDAVEDLALFYHRDIMDKIGGLFQDYVLLPGGGNMVLQQTAALFAIDINRGADKRSNLAINMEAAAELTRHLRLRNIGGAIMVDFIRFQDKKEEKSVLKALDDAIQNDPCTVQIHGMTPMGLLEISRKRRTPPLASRTKGVF
ncbi:MAG: ribonuclease E/G [Alphaproteobacteria bacterium]|nr:ribonuclease E/G [Alphaproteobacteria bacterium]